MNQILLGMFLTLCKPVKLSAPPPAPDVSDAGQLRLPERRLLRALRRSRRRRRPAAVSPPSEAPCGA